MPRIAIVQKEKCNPVGCGGYLCARVCPVNREGQDCIVPGPGPEKKAVIDETLCTGCGICPNRCPFGAIAIINLPEELEHPIHRYGRNGFHLYHLPIPIFGKVVGIIGRNGIGKSTAVKVLAGILKPNLGTEKDASYDELIEYFKGSEAQGYFERLKKGTIKISYKPQQVDLIPHSTKGRVIQVLEKVNEKGKEELERVIQLLDIKNVLQNNIATLSGGELQRVAIAATVLRNANVYFFDEPTSYLDIKQRLRVANFIKSLTNKDTAVMVIEHDLIILDAMTDLIHMMYGKEACYGVVSLPKSSKEGVNTYLSGFIRDENMRFRNKAISFVVRAERKKTLTTPVLTSWDDIAKTLDRFSLEAGKGSVHRQEVVGILGENGIGKTTFVKMLARLIKPDKGVIDAGIKVSYKPQYLEAGDALVAAVLEKALQKYELQLIRPLEIKELLTRKLNELSGGELQRVAIAHSLSQDADLYLLDEPSAYLDIEQRLGVAKVIREFAEQSGKTVLVVDHDLLFIDYVSDRLIVFSGIPAKTGIVQGPFDMAEGMNQFLKDLGITFRRDQESGRPRANKPNSVIDREQKEAGTLYYV